MIYDEKMLTRQGTVYTFANICKYFMAPLYNKRAC